MDCRERLLAESRFEGSKVPSIDNVVRGFLENYDRIVLTLIVPQHFATNGIVIERRWVESGFNSEKFIELQEQGTLSVASRKSAEEIADKLVVLAESEVQGRSPLHKGLEAMLAGTVIAAWAAFEALAADLWEACLNERPRLGFVAMNIDPKPDDSADEAARKNKAKVPFPAWLLLDPNFDFKSKMGTALIQMDKFKFDKRSHAEDAYLAVFPDAKKQIEDAFRNRELVWLNALRNAIVHNAGRMDRDCKKQVTAHPRLGAIDLDTRIPLAGDWVGELAAAAFTQGKLLVSLVDSWLANNPR